MDKITRVSMEGLRAARGIVLVVTLFWSFMVYPNTKEFFLEVRAKQPSKELLSDPDLYYSQEGVEIAARFI